MRKLLLLSLLVAGCAAGEERAVPEPAVDSGERVGQLLGDAFSEAPARARAPIPEGYRLRESRRDDVALAFPPGWQALTSVDARFPGVLETFGVYNRGLAVAVAALGVPDGPMKLLGFDPRLARGFATTASVMKVTAQVGVPYERWSAHVLRRTRALPTTQGRIESGRVRLPLGEALRLRFTRVYGKGGRPLATLQYVVVRGPSAYFVTYSTLPSLQRRYEPLFARSVRTLRTVD
jgi:hypothetical protein